MRLENVLKIDHHSKVHFVNPNGRVYICSNHLKEKEIFTLKSYIPFAILSYSNDGGVSSEIWDAYMSDWFIHVNCLTGWNNSQSDAQAIIIYAGNWKLVCTQQCWFNLIIPWLVLLMWEIVVTLTSHVYNNFSKGIHGRLDSWLIRFGFWYNILIDVEQLNSDVKRRGTFTFPFLNPRTSKKIESKCFAGSTNPYQYMKMVM